MNKAESRYTVEFNEDSIAILFDGIESLYWIKDEWEDDSEVVFSIANAIYQSQRFPQTLLDSGIGHHTTVKKTRKLEGFRACAQCENNEEIVPVNQHEVTLPSGDTLDIFVCEECYNHN